MNAQQRRKEERRRERSSYPAFTEFKPREIHYGGVTLATGDELQGLYRLNKRGEFTHLWLDYDASSNEDVVRYDEFVASEGYKNATKMGVEPKEDK